MLNDRKKMEIMDTARYRAFLMAADTGSIRNAADILGYTSSGVSQLIHAMETELNVKLFHRGKKGVSLTASGEMMLPVVRSLIAQENQILQLASDVNGTILGTVNVASYHSLASAWMPVVIATFQKMYPEVRVNLYEGTQRDIIERLRAEKSDIAFFNDSAMTGKYDWIPLMDDPMLAVIPASHPLAGEEAFPIAKFEDERFIMPDHGYDFDVLDIFSEFHITPNIYLSMFDSYILLSMVENGLGVSIINSACLKGKQISENVRTMPLSPFRSIQMGIAVPSLKEAAPAVRRFAECAKSVIETL